MKRSAVAAPIVFAIAIIGALHWRAGQELSKPAYQPGLHFTAQERIFVQKAHNLLGWAITLDQNAIGISRIKSVREFAQKDLDEQRKLLHNLQGAVSSIDPSFVFQPAESLESSKLQPGIAFDRRYLENIIEIQEQARSMVDRARNTSGNVLLNRFVTRWAASLNARLREANALLDTLN